MGICLSCTLLDAWLVCVALQLGRRPELSSAKFSIPILASHRCCWRVYIPHAPPCFSYFLLGFIVSIGFIAELDVYIFPPPFSPSPSPPFAF